jgi:hypothetical protein
VHHHPDREVCFAGVQGVVAEHDRAVVGWNVTAGDISIRTPFLAISEPIKRTDRNARPSVSVRFHQDLTTESSAD